MTWWLIKQNLQHSMKSLRIRTMGAKIWNSLPKVQRQLLFENLQNSLKHDSNLNSSATSANTPVTNITIRELQIPA